MSTLWFPCDDPKYLSSSDIRSRVRARRGRRRARRGPGSPVEVGAVGVGDAGQIGYVSFPWFFRLLQFHFPPFGNRVFRDNCASQVSRSFPSHHLYLFFALHIQKKRRFGSHYNFCGVSSPSKVRSEKSGCRLSGFCVMIQNISPHAPIFPPLALSICQ